MLAFFATSLGRNILIGIAGVLALGFLVFGVNHAMAEAKQAGRDEIQARWDAEKAGRQQASAEVTEAITQAFNGLDGSLQSFAKTITVKGREITVRMKREIDNEPRYTDVACQLTPGVFDALNAKRRLSANPPSFGGDGRPVRSSEYPVRLELGNTGE